MSAREWFEMGSSVVAALEAIEQLTHVGGDKAAPALSAIRAVLHALWQGFDGKLTPTEVLGQIETLRTHINENDLRALEALRKKFGRED